MIVMRVLFVLLVTLGLLAEAYVAVDPLVVWMLAAIPVGAVTFVLVRRAQVVRR